VLDFRARAGSSSKPKNPYFSSIPTADSHAERDALRGRHERKKKKEKRIYASAIGFCGNIAAYVTPGPPVGDTYVHGVFMQIRPRARDRFLHMVSREIPVKPPFPFSKIELPPSPRYRRNVRTATRMRLLPRRACTRLKETSDSRPVRVRYEREIRFRSLAESRVYPYEYLCIQPSEGLRNEVESRNFGTP